MNFERFDGYPGGEAELKVDWLVLDSLDRPVVPVTRTLLSGPVDGDSIDDLVHALEGLVGNLAVVLADRLVKEQTETGP